MRPNIKEYFHGSIDIASHGPVIPVIVIDRVEDALPLAEALLAGGVKVLEVTLRTAAALPTIENHRAHGPTALVGVGTVLNADDARRASEAGARFAVSPGYTSDVGHACRGLACRCCRAWPRPAKSWPRWPMGSFLKAVSGRAAGGIPLLRRAWASPFGQVTSAPRGRQPNHRPQLPGAVAQCALRGWLVVDACRRHAPGTDCITQIGTRHALRAPV